MRKTVLWAPVILSVFVVGLMLNVALADDEEMCVPLGEITLESLADDATRTPVAFAHTTHFDYSCKECHHKWDGKTPIVGCTTTDCHDLAQVPKTEDGKRVKDPKVRQRYFKNAFHKNCIGCHRQIKLANKKLETSQAALEGQLPRTGPTGCIQCHPKE